MPHTPRPDDQDAADPMPIVLQPVLREALRSLLVMSAVLGVAVIMMFAMMAAPSDEGLFSGNNVLIMVICGFGACLGLAPGAYIVYRIERRRRWLIYDDRVELYDGSELVRRIEWDDVSQVLRFDSFVEVLCKRLTRDETHDAALNEHLENHKIAFVDRHQALRFKQFTTRKNLFSRRR